MNNYQEALNRIKQNSQIMNNQTVRSVYECLARKDHTGLVELYKNTCQTMGQQPNPMFIK